MTSTPSPQPPPTQEEISPTPEPTQYIDTLPPGVFLGTFHGTASSSVTLFEKIGKGVAISAVYLDWSSGFNAGLPNANAMVGRITFITWEYKGGPEAYDEYEGRPLQALLDGVYDDYLRSWAEGVRDFGKPIFIRWGHEMNGDWYLWSGINNGGGALDGFGDPTRPDGPERFVAAYRYIHDFFKNSGATNVLWVWCPNAPFESMQASYGDGKWNAAANYYPGDEYVDWLCFDGYNWGASSFGQQFNSVWTSFDGIFAESYRQLQAINPNKPIIIGEFASTEDGGDKAAWITDTFSGIQNKYPQIRAIIWFHISKETDWRINSSPEALAAFSQAVSSDYWLDTWPAFQK